MLGILQMYQKITSCKYTLRELWLNWSPFCLFPKYTTLHIRKLLNKCCIEEQNCYFPRYVYIPKKQSKISAKHPCLYAFFIFNNQSYVSPFTALRHWADHANQRSHCSRSSVGNVQGQLGVTINRTGWEEESDCTLCNRIDDVHPHCLSLAKGDRARETFVKGFTFHTVMESIIR